MLARAECARRPRDPEAWLRRARTARRLGDSAEAAGALFRAADLHARDRQLVRAAGLVEHLLELDPGHAAGRRLQVWLAQMGIRAAAANLDSDSDGVPDPEEHRLAEGSGPLPTAAARDGQGFGPTTLELAVHHLGDRARGAPPESLDLEVIDAMAATIGSSPLLRELSSDLVRYIQESGSRIKYPAGSVIFAEGDRGNSLYLVLRGRLAVERLRRLAELGPGAFFGEMAALTGATRSATVVAIDDAEVLELSGDSLRILVERSPRLYSLFMRYCRARSVASLLAESPWFTRLSMEEKSALAARFFVRELAAGAVVVRPGERFSGLHFVALGRLGLSQAASARGPAELGPGDAFGEEVLGDGIATREVRALEPSWVLMLPADEAARLSAIGRGPRLTH